jgi:hypothetical protein
MPIIIIPLCVGRSSWAFHLFIIVFRGQIACPDLPSGESRMVDNHPSV